MRGRHRSISVPVIQSERYENKRRPSGRRLSFGGILDFLEGILFQLLPEGGEVGGEGNFVGAVGLVELVFVGDPGGDIG